jgi:hypothetical protein
MSPQDFDDGIFFRQLSFKTGDSGKLWMYVIINQCSGKNPTWPQPRLSVGWLGRVHPSDAVFQFLHHP